MSIKFTTDEWIKELCARLNSSEAYAHAAANWEGDIIFIILPDTEYVDSTYYYINIQHGKAFDARVLSNLDEQKALYTFSAPYSTWRRVIEGRLDPLQGIFSGKLKLVGNMAQVQRNPRAAYELVKVAASIGSDFGA